MRLPTHHPSEALLLDYADGSLAEPAALVVATHLALCPECRKVVAEMEAIGGAVLEDVPPEPLSADCLSQLLARLDAREEQPRRAALSRQDSLVPQPLRSYLGMGMAEIPWRSIIAGLDEYTIPAGHGAMKARLMRIRAGVAVPRHTHEGSELTLVLDGGYRDEQGHFRRGDAVLYGPEVDHRPVADTDGDCTCLTVTDAPLRLTGRIGRFLNAFVRF